MYDQNLLDVVWDLVKGWDVEICEVLWVEVSVYGLYVKVGDINMYDFVCEVFVISEVGLKVCV